MAYQIRMPEGEFLDTLPDFTLQFELNNQVFTSSDNSVLPGSFTFPVDVPLTSRNKRLLRDPHLVTNTRRWTVIEGVWVYCYNMPMFFGNLTIRGADPRRAKVDITANPMRKLKEIMLNKVDMGGLRTVGMTNWPAHMLAAATDPEDFDYTFFPIENPDFNSYEPMTYEKGVQNLFDSGAFTLNCGALTPFAKLEYILKQIFLAEDTGYTFINGWQTDVEQKRLYVYNNEDLRTTVGDAMDLEASMPEEFNLADHVPKMKAMEFMKKTIAHFCLGLFTNPFNKTLELLALEQVLSRPPKHDWTQYAVGEMALESSDFVPVNFNYPALEDIAVGIGRADEATQIKSLGDYDALLPLPNGLYYLESGTRLLSITPTTVGAWDAHAGVYNDPDAALYDTGVEAFAMRANGYAIYNSKDQVSRWYTVDGVTPVEYERRPVDYPLVMMCYRGLQTDDEYGPVASHHVWKTYGTAGARYDITAGGSVVATSERSLNWFGEYGLYLSNHVKWNTMLRNGKHGTQSFALPIAVLKDFSFKDKIRINNMDYFIKRLRIQKPLGKGLMLVEASMVSVI